MVSSLKQQSNSSASHRKRHSTKRSNSRSAPTSKQSSTKTAQGKATGKFAAKQKTARSKAGRSVSSKKKLARKKTGGTRAPSRQAERRSRGTKLRSILGKALFFARRAALVLGAVVGVVIVGRLTLLLLAQTSLFTITSIDTEGSEHISAEEVARLASLPQGTTLLSVDISEIEENIQRNPWVSSVDIRREFPDKLAIEITEREVGYVVVIGGGSVSWYLSDEGIWLEPVATSETEGLSALEVGQQAANELGCILVSDTPSSIDPVAGEMTDDAVLEAILEYMAGLPESLSSQIVQFTASSEANLTCALSDGITILLGEPEDIDIKGSVVNSLLEQYADQITYINVRTPSNPSFRRVDSENVQSGSN